MDKPVVAGITVGGMIGLVVGIVVLSILFYFCAYHTKIVMLAFKIMDWDAAKRKADQRRPTVDQTIPNMNSRPMSWTYPKQSPDQMIWTTKQEDASPREPREGSRGLSNIKRVTSGNSGGVADTEGAVELGIPAPIVSPTPAGVSSGGRPPNIKVNVVASPFARKMSENPSSETKY